MAISITCTGCNKTLNVADTAAGKKVRCPTCKAVVAVPAPEEELVEPDEDLPETGVTSSAPAPTPAAPKKKAAWEKDEPEGKKKKKKKSDDDESYGLDEEDDDDDDEDEDEREERRRRKRKKRRRQTDDYDDFAGSRPRRSRGQPHRGVAILMLGIFSILSLCLCVFLGWVLAGITLNMANEDSAKMERGLMDRSGMGMVTGGKVCAYLAVLLGFVVLCLNIGLIAGGGGRR